MSTPHPEYPGVNLCFGTVSKGKAKAQMREFYLCIRLVATGRTVLFGVEEGRDIPDAINRCFSFLQDCEGYKPGELVCVDCYDVAAFPRRKKFTGYSRMPVSFQPDAKGERK